MWRRLRDGHSAQLITAATKVTSGLSDSLAASDTQVAFTANAPQYFTKAGPVPAISPDGRWIAYGTKGRRIVVARIDIAHQTAGPARTLLRVGRRDDLFSLAWSLDSRQLIFLARTSDVRRGRVGRGVGVTEG